MAAQRGDHPVKMQAEMWMVYLQTKSRKGQVASRNETQKRFLSVAFRWSMALTKWEAWPSRLQN